MVSRPRSVRPLLALALMVGSSLWLACVVLLGAPSLGRAAEGGNATPPGRASESEVASLKARIPTLKAGSQCAKVTQKSCQEVLKSKGLLAATASDAEPWRQKLIESQNYALCKVHTRNPELAAQAFPTAAALQAPSPGSIDPGAASDLRGFAVTSANQHKAAADSATSTIEAQKEALSHGPDPGDAWQRKLDELCQQQVDASSDSIRSAWGNAASKIKNLPGGDQEKMAAVGLFHSAMNGVTDFLGTVVSGLEGLFDHLVDFIQSVYKAISDVVNTVASGFNTVTSFIGGLFG